MIKNNPCNFIFKTVPGSKLFNEMRKELVLKKQISKQKLQKQIKVKTNKKN